MKRLRGTFEKVGREPSFVDGAVGHELEPQLVAAAFDLDGFVITAEAAEQPAALRAAIPHLHVVVAAAVVLLNLRQEQRADVAHDVSRRDTQCLADCLCRDWLFAFFTSKAWKDRPTLKPSATVIFHTHALLDW